MKARMYSEQKHSLLHDHIIDGFAASHEGLRRLKDQSLIKEEEYTQLLEQNIKRLIERAEVPGVVAEAERNEVGEGGNDRSTVNRSTVDSDNVSGV